MMTQAKVRGGWRYDQAEKSALALEDLLGRHGISVRPGSALEQHVLNVFRIVERKQGRGLRAEDEDIRPLYRTLIGVHELASLLLAVKDDPHFRSLVPHLKLLNEGHALQNSPSDGRDQATDKLFELYMAAAALQCGTDLELDHPTRSKGDNPDILVTIGDRRWGIACKVLHGDSTEGFITHLEKGLQQIEVSSAELGIVAFNVKNILSHDVIWPLAPMDGIQGNPSTSAVWSDFRAPLEMLMAQMEGIGLNLLSYLSADYLVRMFSGRKSIPAFLLWGASPSAAMINGQPTACSVRALNCHTVGGLSASEAAGLKCINWGIYADSEDRGPKPCMTP